MAADRVFVVKLSADTDRARLVGQVEHVSSGASARFEVLEQLGVFMSEILVQEQGEPKPHRDQNA